MLADKEGLKESKSLDLKVSVITVVYNNVSHIGACIDSVVSQSYDNVEYIIIDGKSTDGTWEVIDSHRDKIAKVVCEEDKGHIYAMNKGIMMATGDIIGFLHSDDIYMNSRIIELVADEFKKKPVDSLYGDLVYVKKDNTSRVVRYWEGGLCKPENIRRGWMPPHPTFFVKRKIYGKYGLLDTSFKISMDYEIILRFLYKYRISVSYIPSVLVKMRSGGVSNRNIKNIAIKTVEDYRAARLYGLGLSTVFMKNIAKIPQCIHNIKFI